MASIKRILSDIWFRQGRWQPWAERRAEYRREAADYWFHVYRPQPGDVIVDIGAGCGEDVYAFSEGVGAEGVVWALEAHPETFKRLERFCRKRRLSNVRCIRRAVMDRRAMLHIETQANWQANSISDRPRTPASEDVESLPFDDICLEHGIARIDFLKMNIEGAERFALAGMSAALARTRHICVAAHDFRADRGEGEQFRTRDFVVKALEAAGFTLALRTSDPRSWVRDQIHGTRS